AYGSDPGSARLCGGSLVDRDDVLLGRGDELWRGHHRERGLDGRDRVEAVVDDPEVREPARAHEDATLERADGLVVGARGRTDRAAELCEVRAHRRKPAVQLLAEGE